MDLEKTLPGIGQNPLRLKKREGDRRIYERLPTLTLSTSVKVRYGLFLKWREVELVDYSPAGFAFQCSTKFRDNQAILMQLLLKLDKVDIFITDIVADIRNRSQVGGDYRYGTEFNFQATQYMQSREVQDKLRRIEKLVKKALMSQKK